MVFVYLRRQFFMRILGGTKAATSGAGYLWEKSLQANWELGDFSPLLLENLVGNNFTCWASKCASSGSLTTYVNKNLMQDYSPWISKNIKLTKYSAGPPKKKFIDDDLRLKARSKRREARTQPLLSRK